MSGYADGRLTALRIRRLSAPGRYGDGNGLYLIVDESGAKRWVLRTIVQGRRRDMGLGGARLVSLADARNAAVKYRRIARDGGDPFAERRRNRNLAMTFAEAAICVHSENIAAWKNKKHRAQWISSLQRFVFPAIGSRPVNQLSSGDIIRVLTPIWLAKPETARRVRQRLRAVFDWAKAMGHCEGDNPVDGVLKALPKQSARQKHHAAVPYGEVPSFVRAMRRGDNDAATKLAFEFLILTAARTGEVLGARWDEIDLENAVWIVPAERMKAGRAHRVPLSDRALEILRDAAALRAGADCVFAGKQGRPLSNMAFLMTMRRMGVAATVHGFRSDFRDWAAERTNFAREVCERALAHTIKNKAEAAYQRGDILDKRRKLMDAWSRFVCSDKAAIIPFKNGAHVKAAG